MRGNDHQKVSAMQLDWTTEKEETILRDKWIDLRAETCRMPNGTEIAPYYVLHYPEWVSVLAITTEDQAILLREFRNGAKMTGLGMVGGGMETTDTSPEDTARRELIEETGYGVGELFSLGSAFANWGNQTNRVHYFLATGCAIQQQVSFDQTEYCELVLKPKHELFNPGVFQQLLAPM